MFRRHCFTRMAMAAVLCLAGAPPAPAADAQEAPNIIFILTDDQGWTSVSYRSDPEMAESKSDYIETPRMARAAREGMRFTDAYAPNPICSPTRHGILFGQNCARNVYGKDLDWLAKAPDWLTIPKAIKQANPEYRTAYFGKWHVGVMPDEAGYDFSDGPTSNGQGDSQNGAYKDVRGVEDLLGKYNAEHGIVPRRLNGKYSAQPVFYTDEDPKLTSSMNKRAAAFMRESVADGKPFYAQISHFATHLAMVATDESYDHFKSKKPGAMHDNPGYAAMALDMDAAIGEVLDLVKELGIEDNTYIFIMSDNGGVQHFGQTATLSESNEIVETFETNIAWRNLPLRHGKHEYYEGGIRVPFLVLGPDIEPNSVSRVPVTGLDFLPTFADLAGHDGKFPDTIDGGSIVSVLRNGGAGEVRRGRESLIFHQAAKRVPVSAIRKGNYKLVKHWLAEDKGENRSQYYGDNVLELYDLDKDIGEINDLSKEMPDLAAALDAELQAFFDEVNAETEYTRRWDAFNEMKKAHGIEGNWEIPVEYHSPFAGE